MSKQLPGESSAVVIQVSTPNKVTRARRCNISLSNRVGLGNQKSTFSAERVSMALN